MNVDTIINKKKLIKKKLKKRKQSNRKFTIETIIVVGNFALKLNPCY